MTTQFTYLNKEYQVNVDANNWYDKESNVITIVDFT